MADWFVGPVMEKIIDAFSDYLQDQFRRQTGKKEELERLRENHPKIKAIVSAYTRAQIKDPALNRWIWQLRDAIDEADEVLDGFEYARLEEQLEQNMEEEAKVRSPFTRIFSEPARKFLKRCEGAFKIDPEMERLEAVVKKLDQVSAEVSIFRHLLENAMQEQKDLEVLLRRNRETGSFPKNDFIGREKEKDFVMRWLSKPTNDDPTHHIATPSFYKNISLLSVVGHGGMGKTALLHHIFKDFNEEFKLKIWVCVSNEFDAKKVIADMLEFICKKRPRLESLSSLQASLQAEVQSKRFLLVMDNIWEKERSKWEDVLSPLTNGSFGSKILITTRMDEVASVVAKVIEKKLETLRIEGLKEDVCLKLLNNHAFAGVENLGAHKKLTDIASLIVKKLSGCPLAAKNIGGALNSNLNESFWMNILNSPDILKVESEPGCNDILSVLRLSFKFLPQPLQNCFAFCGIFPQDHQFNKDDLVRMWIALGFIQESAESASKRETLEDIGGRYFDFFVRNSFFDEFQEYRRIYFKMHDLLHDLAKSISSEECFRFVGDNVSSLQIPKNVRHLFIETGNLEVLRMIKDVKNIHSLFLLNDTADDPVFTEILTTIFEASRNLRLLFIRSHCLKNMSETIKKLRHLRYLNLVAQLTQMPRSLSRLYHLRFIIYKDAFYQKSRSDYFLPGDVSNLSNLRHLELSGDVSVPGIGKLTSLQELNEFNVKNENGYRISELEHLSELRKLKINFLKNVKDASEARTAKLCEKGKLKDLILSWDKSVDESNERVLSLPNIVNSDFDVNVLENLEPNKNLKSFSIVSYEGTRSAKWMHKDNLISNLEHISLNGCSEWETLPPFGRLPYLKSLFLRNMPKAKRIDYNFNGNDKVSVFPSLEVLNIEGLQELKDWFDGVGAAAYGSFFPCLTELFLHNCPKLQELPYLPPKLKKMKIQNIGWKAALNCKQETNNTVLISNLEYINLNGCLEWETFPPFAQLPHLKSLYLCNLPKAKRIDYKFHVNDKVSVFPSLGVLDMRRLPVLEDWFDVAGAAAYDSFFPCLTKLFLYDCPNLQELPYLPPKLEKMRIDRVGWKALNCKQGTSKSIPLETLDVFWCPNITSLLLTDVRYLSIEGCPNLISLGGPQQVESGAEKFQLILSRVVIDDPSLLPTVGIASLESLIISKNDVLVSLTTEVEQWFPHFSSSLRDLCFSSLKSLQSLPSSLERLSSLKTLRVKNVPRLQQLLYIPACLERLELQYLESLVCLPSSCRTSHPSRVYG